MGRSSPTRSSSRLQGNGGPEALRHLGAQVGSSQLVVGTDYPFPWTKTAVDHILGTPGFSDAERAAMLGETAGKLLGLH